MALGSHISLADTLGLEAIRLFLPQVLDLLPASIDSGHVPADRADAITDERYVINLGCKLLTGVTRCRSDHRDRATEVPAAQRDIRGYLSPCSSIPLSGGAGRRLPITQSPDRTGVSRSQSVLAVLFFDCIWSDSDGEEVLALDDAERALKCMNDLHAFSDRIPGGRCRPVALHSRPFERLPRRNDSRPEQVEPGLVGLWNLLEYESGAATG